jgi:hypothetical protein
MRRGDWAAARTDLDESIRLARSMSARYELALSLRARARLAEETGEPAAPFLDECEPILARLGVAPLPLIESR